MSTERRPHLFANAPSCYRSRRQFLQGVGEGFGGLALTALLGQEDLLARPAEARLQKPLSSRPGHFRSKAKSVIWLFMNGGPSPARAP